MKNTESISPQATSDVEEKHPRLWEPATLILVIVTAILGAVIGLQLIVTLGVTPSTSIIGAIVAMVLARIPIAFLKKFRSVHRQNLIQTSISSATFGAANSLMIPIGIPFILGRSDLILPMFIGAVLAMLVDTYLLYKMFDSRVFPASGAWPLGTATAEAIVAGDQGGKRAKFLGLGALGGVIGTWMGIPMSAFGTAFIGNIWALTMFGIGLLVNGYSEPLFGMKLGSLYIPHGLMIGAGLVALVQVILVVTKKRKEDIAVNEEHGISEASTNKTLRKGFLMYLGVSLVIAVLGGLLTEMSVPMFIGFLIFAAFAAYFHELIVGIAAMHSGWFPAFAVALITLVIGIMVGFPPVALALLVGFSAATGPAFADMGYDLKAGHMLRKGKSRQYEKDGRAQQYYTGLVAFGVAALAVFLSYKSFFAQDLVPPVDRVYVATIQAGISSDVAMKLLLWAIPGAILQWIGGPNRQLGVLFATGLLITMPAAGWAVLAGIVIRFFIRKFKGEEAEKSMGIVAAGFIAGDAVYSFGGSIVDAAKGGTK